MSIGDSSLAAQVTKATQEPNGFPVDPITGEVDRTTSTISFDDGTRTFTIEPTSDYFELWIAGKRFIISEPHSVQSDDLNGDWFFYFDTVDGAPVLIADQVSTPKLIYRRGFCAFGYWSVVDAKMLFGGPLDERHGVVMDGATHYNMHVDHGTVWESGLALTDIITTGNGNDTVDAQFGIDVGVVYDEDLRFEIPTKISTVGVDRVLYKETDGTWHEDKLAQFSLLVAGSGRLAYNPPSGSLVELGNNHFCLYHIIATSGQDMAGQVVAIPGQIDYLTLNNIQNAAEREINNLILAGLPLAEFKFLGSILLQTSDSYSNGPKARVRPTDEGFDYLDYRRTISAVERKT